MPVPSCQLFERLYRYLVPRRKLLFGATLLVVVMGCLATTKARIQEDIVAMLPDDGSAVAQDFHLLQLAPFTRKIVITVKAGGTDPAALTEATDRLAQALAEGGVGKVTTGPADMSGGIFGWLGRALPSLATGDDLSRLAAATTGPEVRKRLRQSYEQLLSPEGWALKGSIQNDPLSFSAVALEKMRFLNMIPNMRLVNNHFVSADGKSALIFIDSTVAMTDSAGSRDLLGRIQKAVAAAVPRQMSATVLCGHSYTLVNADTIKRDLAVVLTVNTIAVLAIYIIFLRSLSAIFVFLVPSSILVIASGMIALYQGNVFALTLGFGGVLLGIADEYAMLIYFSCRQGGKDIGTITGEVARPVLFGAAATLISFGVMLTSSLPGQRQLAIYSMTGIVASLLISLIVLPHLIKPAPEGKVPLGNLMPQWQLPRRAVIWCWLIILAICGWQATKIRFNGDLRAINLVTPELRQAEAELTKTWGDMRGKAIIFAEGKDLDAALSLNERLFARISGKLPAGELVSIAPLLPGQLRQQANLERWKEFWRDGRADHLAADLGREGATIGFTKAAFAPFLSGLKDPGPGVTVESLREAGVAELVDSMIVNSAGVVRVLTLVPDTPQVLAALDPDLKALPGVHLVSQGRFGDNVGRAIVNDFSRYMVVTSVLVFGLVVALFRKPTRIMLVLVPVVTGIICMLGIMGMLGLEFNIFNIAATILIIGLCVDYGIFMVCKLTEGSSHAANRAVLVSGLTTLAGLGALALAEHPSMHSIGITVLLGIGTGIPAALLVIPALCFPHPPAPSREGRGRVPGRARVWVALLSLLLLTACSTVPFKATELTPVPPRTAAELCDGLWTRKLGSVLIRQSALFELHGLRVPLAGVMKLDSTTGTARLVGMNDMGVKLYDISVDRTSSKANFVMPELDRYPAFAEAVGNSVRRIFLDPLPSPGDALRTEPTSYRLTQESGDGKINFVFGGAGAQMLEKSCRGKASWRVRYFQYQPMTGKLIPEGIVLDDDRAGYRLTIWIESVEQSDE